MNQSGDLFVGMVLMSGFKVLALELLSRRHRYEWFEVGELERINLYPLKSTAGIELERARCHFDGLQITTESGVIVKDRTFMVVTSTMEMVTARQKPKLLHIKCSISDDGLILNAPGMQELIFPRMRENPPIHSLTCVFGDTIEGVDCGDGVAEWLNRFLGTEGYRILHNTVESSKRMLALKVGKWFQYARNEDQVAYQDGFPYMMVTSTSFEDVNKRLFAKYGVDHKPVLPQCFRANFFIRTDNPPFSEDDWIEIKIGECHFFNMRPCVRCVLTTIDPISANRRRDLEPLKMLKSFRLIHPEFGVNPCFGINMTLLKPGGLQIGDKVFVKRSSSSL